jgi:hypothetical protein
MSAIFYVLRTGCQWNALRSLGASVQSMIGSKNGGRLVYSNVCGLMESAYDKKTGIDWKWQTMDGEALNRYNHCSKNHSTTSSSIYQQACDYGIWIW